MSCFARPSTFFSLISLSFALQAGNSESIVKCHYLNTHTQDEGNAFFRTVPDLAARKSILAPQQVPTTKKHLRAV